MHLSGRVLDWDLDVESWSIIEKEKRTRAEHLLSRSELQLNYDKSKDARAECLITLKRCLNQRLKAIEEIHEFKELDIPSKPKGYLELLERIGILRPLLLKNLLRIRNEIEHEDADPPSFNQCKEYVDVVWYFLKSTNQKVSLRENTLVLRKLRGDQTETQYWISLDLKDKHYNNIHITGWVPQSYLKAVTKSQSYLSLDISEMGTKEERWPDSKIHKDKIPTDTWVNGYLLLTDAQRLKLVQQVMNI